MLLAEVVAIRESRIATYQVIPILFTICNATPSRPRSRETRVRRSQSDGYRKPTCATYGRRFVLSLHRLNGANGMSDIEGKVTRVGASERGQRTSFNGANGMSDIEGKVTRVGASERGQRTSFNGANGMSGPPSPTLLRKPSRAGGVASMEGKATRVAARMERMGERQRR